jgi:nucleotide-binding universal stress UspA family protein
MTERILCAVDFSDCSHAALAHALELSNVLHARLDVVHAYYVPENIRPDLMVWKASTQRPLRELAEERARAELDGFLARHGADIRSRLDVHVVLSDPTSAILELATGQASTLIVLGTHGRSGAKRLMIGSVAERVVRLAPCPVFTVREPAHRASAASLRRILVAVDFSECSRVALQRAGELARAFGAKLHVVHVWQVPVFLSPDSIVGEAPWTKGTSAELVEREAQSALTKFVETARKAGAVVDAVRMVQGEPAHAIVSEAEQLDCDLIALGTHGRTGIKRVLLGSVVEKVVRCASRPVLSVREAGQGTALR